MGLATEEQAAALIKALKERDADREARMPDFRAALHQASAAQERLKKRGWREGIYCPKDGTDFAVIEWGSTGVHRAHYMGEWPEGHIYCGDFLVHPHGVMFKALDNLTDDERIELEKSDVADKQFMERQFASFSTCQE